MDESSNGQKESGLLYQFLATLFCVIVILSNLFSAKMVPLPIFGHFAIPAGLITYPLTFLISDLVTEFFGLTKAKRMVYLTLGMNLVAFALLEVVLLLPSQNLNEHEAFQSVLGLGGLRIVSSLTAFTIAQLVDIQMYALIKRWTGFRFLWIRANGSTWVSQAIDTLVIDLLYLYWGIGMALPEVVPIMLFSLAYKFSFALTATPLFYLTVFFIKKRKESAGRLA